MYKSYVELSVLLGYLLNIYQDKCIENSHKNLIHFIVRTNQICKKMQIIEILYVAVMKLFLSHN